MSRKSKSPIQAGEALGPGEYPITEMEGQLQGTSPFRYSIIDFFNNPVQKN